MKHALAKYFPKLADDPAAGRDVSSTTNSGCPRSVFGPGKASHPPSHNQSLPHGPSAGPPAESVDTALMTSCAGRFVGNSGFADGSGKNPSDMEFDQAVSLLPGKVGAGEQKRNEPMQRGPLTLSQELKILWRHACTNC